MSQPREKYPYLYVDELEQFDCLPQSYAFEQVLLDHLTERCTTYQSDDPISVTQSVVPEELKMIFSSDENIIDEIKIILTQVSDASLFEVNLRINGIDYHFIRTSELMIVTVPTANDQDQSYELPKSCATLLVAALMLASNQGHGYASIPNDRPQLQHDPDIAMIERLLIAMAQLKGRVDIVTKATFESPDNKAIVAQLRETDQPDSNGVDNQIGLSWQSDEFNQYETHIAQTDTILPVSQKHQFAYQRPTGISPADFILSREFPSLFPDPYDYIEPKRISPQHSMAEWCAIVHAFMSTVGPSLEKYKHLDS